MAWLHWPCSAQSHPHRRKRRPRESCCDTRRRRPAQSGWQPRRWGANTAANCAPPDSPRLSTAAKSGIETLSSRSGCGMAGFCAVSCSLPHCNKPRVLVIKHKHIPCYPPRIQAASLAFFRGTRAVSQDVILGQRQRGVYTSRVPGAGCSPRCQQWRASRAATGTDRRSVVGRGTQPIHRAEVKQS